MSQQWTETLHRLFSNDDFEVLAELRRFRLQDDINLDIIDCAVCAIYFFICLLKYFCFFSSVNANAPFVYFIILYI